MLITVGSNINPQEPPLVTGCQLNFVSLITGWFTLQQMTSSILQNAFQKQLKKKKKRLSSLKTFFMKTSPSVYPNRSLLPGISQCGTSSGLYCCNVTMNTAITHLQEWFTPRAAYSCCIEVQALRECVRTATKMASLTGRPWYLMTCLG